VIGLTIAFEKARKKIRSDPLPCIRNYDFDVGVLFFHLDIDPASGGRKLDRVAQQVDQDLLESAGIGAHRDNRGIDRKLNRDALFVRGGPNKLKAGLVDRLDQHRRGLQLQLARANLREIQNIVDQTEQRVSGVLDGGQVVAPRLVRITPHTGAGDRSFFDIRSIYYYGFSLQDVQSQLPIIHPVLDYSNVLAHQVAGGELSYKVNLTSLSRQQASFDAISQTAVNTGACTSNTADTAVLIPSNCLLRGIPGEYNRASAEVDWRRTLVTYNGQEITPFLHLRGDFATLNINNQPGVANYIAPGQSDLARVMPTAGVEYRYPLIDVEPWGTQTIEPIAQLIVRPNETDIGKFPNEDAQSLVFDDSDLFKIDKFSGWDRAEGGGRANVGFQYTAQINRAGSVNVLFGESYQLFGINSFTAGVNDITNTGLNSGLDKTASDYVGRVTYQPNTVYSFTARGRFDQQTFSVERFEAESRANFDRWTLQLLCASEEHGLERPHMLLVDTGASDRFGDCFGDVSDLESACMELGIAKVPCAWADLVFASDARNTLVWIAHDSGDAGEIVWWLEYPTAGLVLGRWQMSGDSDQVHVGLGLRQDEAEDEVEDEVKDNYAEHQLKIETVQIMQDELDDLSGANKPIEIKLFSENPDLLAQWAPKVADKIKTLPGVTDVKNGIENTISGPALIMNVDPAIAARAGFTPQEVELDASAILQGEPAPTPVIVNSRPYTMRVRFPPQTRSSLQQIENTLLTSSTGKTATLGSLADIRNEAGQTEIIRENLQRDVAVTGRFEGVSLGKGIASVQRAVDTLHIPSAIRVVYGGTYEEQQRSFRDLALVLALAVVLVFTVLLFEFGSFAAPISILASALLSTSGVFIALLITGITFNISSFMGLIMVIGIVAKNGILLLDADQRFRAEGLSARDAMLKAGERRLRPILMTALATVAGMIPLSLALGAGSQMLQPLAIAVIGGILASMVLSLIVTPAVHYFSSDH